MSVGSVVEPKVRAERRVDGLHHRDFDFTPDACSAAVEQGSHDGAVKMHAAEEIADGGAGFQRRPIALACHAHDAGDGLHREVHCREIAVWPVIAEAGS